MTRPREALAAGCWFREGDVHAMVRPQGIAAALGIGPSDAARATVACAGVEHTVIGILDGARWRGITGPDGEPLAPVDFILAQKLIRQGAAGDETAFREHVHLAPDTAFYVPFRTAANLGAGLRSVAVNLVGAARVEEACLPAGRRWTGGCGSRARRGSRPSTWG